jgi:hypothetical protein
MQTESYYPPNSTSKSPPRRGAQRAGWVDPRRSQPTTAIIKPNDARG